MILLTPTTSTVQGVRKKVYPEPNGKDLFFGSFRTFQGTERDEDGIYTLLDTATVDTYYKPEIKADCAVYLPDTGETYEIIGKPENISMRNQYMQFRVQRVGGKA